MSMSKKLIELYLYDKCAFKAGTKAAVEEVTESTGWKQIKLFCQQKKSSLIRQHKIPLLLIKQPEVDNVQVLLNVTFYAPFLLWIWLWICKRKLWKWTLWICGCKCLTFIAIIFTFWWLINSCLYTCMLHV